MRLFATQAIVSAIKNIQNIYFVRFVYISNGQTYFNYLYIYLTKFTLRTLLDKVVSVEITNKNLIIVVKIPRQQHVYIYLRRGVLFVIGANRFSNQEGVLLASDNERL